jgi:hypothetical protein
MLVRLARWMWRNRSDVGNSYLISCLAFQVFLLITARFSESKCPILLSQSRFICREGLPRKGIRLYTSRSPRRRARKNMFTFNAVALRL